MTLRRMLAPHSVALIGERGWTEAVARASLAVGYQGKLWRVHPSRASTADVRYYRSIDDLPESPDSAFVAVPSHEAPKVAAALARREAGGFVCFSSGFAELETAAAIELTRELQRSAGAMPFLGPNCYGMVNFFDRAALWPDQVVGKSPERGVALICQSGTIALTLMFSGRSLPLGYVITIGNQTRLTAADLITELCDDPRVTAIGLYLEGIQDGAEFARAAHKARSCGKPLALVKSGRTPAAARTARSHTGALTGSDSVFDAFCRQAGIARCETLGTLCETLKLLHAGGPLAGRRVIFLGASGGDMAMTSDLSRHLQLEFPAFPPDKARQLRRLLSDRVSIANPFDIHTYLWFEHAALRRVFDAVLGEDVDAVAFMLDCPPEASCDLSTYTPVIDQFVAAAAGARPRAVLLASLPENLNASIRENCMARGVVPLQGLREGLEALDQAGAMGAARRLPEFPVPRLPQAACGTALPIGEHAAKAVLARYGVPVPHGRVVRCADAAATATELGFPVAIKVTGAGILHKSDRGGVALNVGSAAEASLAAARMAALSPQLLVERMVVDGVAEILVGLIVDPQFGQVLVLAAGGTHAELWQDRVSLLPPWTRPSIAAALGGLNVARLLAGYRGQPAGDVDALTDAVMAIGRYAADHCEVLVEMDVNPLIVRPHGLGVVAVDAMISTRETS